MKDMTLIHDKFNISANTNSECYKLINGKSHWIRFNAISGTVMEIITYLITFKVICVLQISCAIKFVYYLYLLGVIILNTYTFLHSTDCEYLKNPKSFHA